MKKLLGILVLGLLVCNTSFASGKCIEGNCENGQGTYTFDGDKYVGEFKDSTFHGQGIITSTDGKIFKGIWKKGELVKKLK